MDQSSTVHRPWGHYTNILKSEKYLLKLLCIDPHQKISLQLHKHRSEHWVVVEGSGIVECEEDVLPATSGDHFFIDRGKKHRLVNNSDDDLIIVELQMGAILDEDDIVRFEDIYGRALK